MQLNVYDTGLKANQKDATSLVFVHGVFHGSWCWQDNFIPYFEKLGYRCLAMDIRGHGKSEGKEQLNKYKMDDYVEDIRSVVEGLRGKVVVIGHSMGGVLVERFIQNHQVYAAVLITPPPLEGASASFNRLSKNISRIDLLKFVLMKNPFVLVKNPKVSKLMFFTEEMSDEDYKVHYNRLGKESYAVIMEILKPFIKGYLNPLKVPILLIGAYKDGFFTPDEINATADQYGVQPVFFEGGHDLMLETSWNKVAESIEKWLVTEASKH